jgi:hypothetical protein
VGETVGVLTGRLGSGVAVGIGGDVAVGRRVGVADGVDVGRNVGGGCEGAGVGLGVRFGGQRKGRRGTTIHRISATPRTLMPIKATTRARFSSLRRVR